jgi:hypothetical protein
MLKSLVRERDEALAECSRLRALFDDGPPVADVPTLCGQLANLVFAGPARDVIVSLGRGEKPALLEMLAAVRKERDEAVKLYEAKCAENLDLEYLALADEGSVANMQRVIDETRNALAMAEVRLSVLDGTSCDQERAMGNGGCGLCGGCCKRAREERDDATIELRKAESRCREAEASVAALEEQAARFEARLELMDRTNDAMVTIIAKRNERIRELEDPKVDAQRGKRLNMLEGTIRTLEGRAFDHGYAMGKADAIEPMTRLAVASEDGAMAQIREHLIRQLVAAQWAAAVYNQKGTPAVPWCHTGLPFWLATLGSTSTAPVELVDTMLAGCPSAVAVPPGRYKLAVR